MSESPAILVVDDEAVHRAFVAAVLALRGWRVDGAASGEAALRAVAAQPYTLILMDMQMPGMDGTETTAAIRAMGGAGAVMPIVALTALDGAVVEQRIAAAGLDGHLLKPCSPAALVATVERWRPTDGQDSDARLGAIFGKAEMARLLDRLRDRLTDAIELCDDPFAAQRLAHSLAGVAGTLGFPEVHRHWLALSEGDLDALEPARDAARKALLTLHRRA